MLQKITYTQLTPTPELNIGVLCSRFKNVCVFDSNKKANKNNHTLRQQLVAIGATQEIVLNDTKNALTNFQSFCNKNKNWIFGGLSYELKNDIEALSSKNIDKIAFPALYFFVPELVLEIENDTIIVNYDDAHLTIEEANGLYKLAFTESKVGSASTTKPTIQSRISKTDYIQAIKQLKQHILRGDIYEINFCQEFFSENASIDPVKVYDKLNAISEAPFAAFCKFDKHYLLSSSPERFIKKQGNTLLSQPIKGTAKRSQNLQEDEQLKNALRANLKEQNENVMIVDLVRNDLSRIAQRGSVNVDELFEVYSFKQVHQLISTVSCDLKPSVNFSDILKATFPMGSMTGAPKVRAMQLIEHYESTQRGLYSGAVGYIAPNGDFDFSVVIRSILYNANNNYLSFMVGSAITAKAEAEAEYDECLLKAKAMFEVLQQSLYS